MNILTTGGSELIGSSVNTLLQKQGHQVTDASGENGVDLLIKAEFDQFFSDAKPDLIIHMSSFTDIAVAQQEEDDYTGFCYRLNAELTRSIAEYAFNNNCHLIYFSTDYVFAGNKKAPYTEEDQPEPQTWFGLTKYLGEREVVASGANYTILRTAQPFGHDYLSGVDLVSGIAQHIEKGTLAPMFNDQSISPTYTDDVARAVVAVVEHLDTARNQTYHLAGDEALSPFELAQRIQAQLSMFEPIQEASAKNFVENRGAQAVLYPNNLALSNKLFKDTFGFTFTPLDQALAQVLSG